MRTIKIANAKKRDASVSFETKQKGSGIEHVLPDGSNPKNVRILKSSIEQDLPALLEKYGDLDNVAEAIINGDPEIDMEKSGFLLDSARKLFMTKDHKILYGVDLYEVLREPDGSEKDRHLYTKTQSNINVEAPIRWSGKFFPKTEAIRKFVFSKKYQIRHVNGLSYDFLHDIAKELHEKDALMLIGSGKKGMLPLIFHDGAIPYRGFLEGRVKADAYCLILHLTQLELKELS